MRCRRYLAVIGLTFSCTTLAAGPGHVIQTGEGLHRMCLGADKLKALSMMCHSYLNGYLDAALYLGKGGRFCLGAGDKERLPVVIITWLNAHPDAMKKSAPEALGKMLSENYPCH